MASSETTKSYYELKRFTKFSEGLKKLGLDPKNVSPTTLTDSDYQYIPVFLRTLPDGYSFTSFEVHYLNEIRFNLKDINGDKAYISCKIVRGELLPHLEVVANHPQTFFKEHKPFNLQMYNRVYAVRIDNGEANQIIDAVLAILGSRSIPKKTAFA